jgi:hypothetical protein
VVRLYPLDQLRIVTLATAYTIPGRVRNVWVSAAPKMLRYACANGSTNVPQYHAPRKKTTSKDRAAREAPMRCVHA